MGNASGKSEGERSSSAQYGEESYEQQGMEIADAHSGGAHASYHTQQQGGYAEAPPMLLHSPPQSSGGYPQSPLIFTPQVPMVPLPRPGEALRVQNYALKPSTTGFRDGFAEKPRAVMIAWNHDGKQVALTGSWDNWGKRVAMHRTGKDFTVMKMLPSGVYHYRFLVDGQYRYAPDLPWECDDSGTAYNILDVQEYVPEAPESLSEFEPPPSPLSSYGNESLNEDDFGKPPPEVPPQLQSTVLNTPSSDDGHESMERPRHAVLNHLYIQNNPGQPIALGSTHRFLHKYVTVVLYKRSRR